MANPFARTRTSRSLNPKKLESIQGFEAKPHTSIRELVRKMHGMGLQATHLSQGAEIIEKMVEENVSVYVSCTSNIVSSGLRETLAGLVRDRKIAGIVTTTGAIEEDFMKCSKPFKLASFDVFDEEVKRNKMNRIGNILVPDEYYVAFEKFHLKFIEKRFKEKREWAPSEYIHELGKTVSDTHSLLYWAARNNTPIYCPGLVDGAIGMHFLFFNQDHQPGIAIDTASDLKKFYNQILSDEKTGGLVIGGGIAKHHLIGASILRNGLDYAVYVSTGTQYDGSLSGAHPKEALSWNKLKARQNSVHIEAEATLVLPLLAQAFY